MGWGRMMLLGDWGQQMDIEDHQNSIRMLSKQASALRRVNASQAERIDALCRENDEFRLYLASIVRLLVSKGAFTKEELAKFVEVIDASDGVADGRFGGEIVQ